MQLNDTTTQNPEEASTAAKPRRRQPRPPSGARALVAAQPALLPLDDLHVDQAALNQQRVADLAGAIARHGFFRLVAVDRENTVVIGQEAVAALRLLHDTDPAAFAKLLPDGQIPVQRHDVAVNGDAERAKLIASMHRGIDPERRQRIQQLAEKLVSDGVHHQRGPAKAGAPRLAETLVLVTGEPRHRLQCILPRVAKAERPLKRLPVAVALDLLTRMSPDERVQLVHAVVSAEPELARAALEKATTAPSAPAPAAVREEVPAA